MIEEIVLKPNQRRRVLALMAARSVLAETTGGPFNNTSKAVDTQDLHRIASWILDGEDPWND